MSKQRFNVYNPELKNRYMEWKQQRVENDTKFIKQLFTKICDYETELGKDVCMFNSYEIANMFYRIDTPSHNVLANYRSILRQYVDWCISKNITLDGQNHFDEIDIDELIYYRNSVSRQQMYFDREKLLGEIKSINPVYQFIILAPFEGIYGPAGIELRRLREQDVEGTTVKLYTGRVLDISTELARVISMAAREADTVATEEHDHRLAGNEGLILRAKYTKKTAQDIMTVGTMNRVFKRACADAGFSDELTFKRVMFFGMVQYIRDSASKQMTTVEEICMDRNFLDHCSKRFGLSIEYSKFYERNLKQFFEN